ncbi:HlyD family efflux transporter periplasmic adaptor subunit [Hydrogenophaga sp. 5NK40-0174]|uniref:HlyD family efflux transporter periplasmic adaptor subunit n=1 Tax=Hydrogenophaga sp. 5NK40-0174 TaxID=3127649 RepID=UPI003107CC51
MDRTVNASETLSTKVNVVKPRQAPKPIPLPAIRDELKLFEAAANHDGTPAWMIQDPVNNRFFRIGWLEFELLLHWDMGEARAALSQINQATPLNATLADVKEMVEFLSDNQLLKAAQPSDVGRLVSRLNRQKKSTFDWLFHNYLFFRIPLVRPQQKLEALRPWLQSMPWGLVAWLIMGLTFVGLYLVSRQWDVFAHTFVDNLSLSGVLGYGVALVFAKTCHELGHALAATRYGVRVAHMGVAFLVMFPMLYTDTGESWRLKDNRQRLRIASAGMAVELALAGLSTFLWSITSDGPLRNGLFFLATTSWVMTLLINASPFMRFDGYFIASDILDMPNLHQRSSAMAQTWLRRALLGFGDDWPETVPDAKRKALITFALTTWIYRLVVFLGIAALVYYFFFKVLGIVMMAFELFWFIGKPVVKELAVWKSRKDEILPSRKAAMWLTGLAGLVVLVMPFQSSIRGEGWLHARNQHLIHAPFPAQLVKLPVAGPVTAGATLLTLDSRSLSIAQDRASALARAREEQIAGLLGLPDGEAQRRTLQSQKAMFEAEAKLSSDERARLTLRAPFAGELVDIDPLLSEGGWVKSRQPLAMLIDRSSWVVDALVEEADLALIEVGDTARVRVMTSPDQWLSGVVEAIDVSRINSLPSEALDAQHGGPIVTVEPPDGQINGQDIGRVPKDALFRVRVKIDEPPVTHAAMAARVVIEGDAHSLLARATRRVVSVFVRESGF